MLVLDDLRGETATEWGPFPRHSTTASGRSQDRQIGSKPCVCGHTGLFLGLRTHLPWVSSPETAGKIGPPTRFDLRKESLS